MSHTVTCFARGYENDWEAICVDYDIAVQGHSFQEVYDDLGVAIQEYVDSALAEHPDQARRLLRRAVPWHVKVRQKVQLLWALCWNRDDEHSLRAGFTVACRA